MQLDKSAADILSVTCNGGSNGQTYVTGAGGTLPYNYLWNDALSQTTDTAINLAPGNYSVTITDSNGCTASDVSTITEPNVIIGKDVQFACDSYTWIDGNIYTASNNSATDTLIATNGCDSIVTLELTVNYNNAATDVQVACDTLTWIDGITYSASNNTATYMLPTKGGCDSLVTLNLIINNSPIVELGNDTTICANTTFTLDAGSGFNYSWSDKTTNQIFPVINTGDYDVTVTDGNGCKDSDTITVTISSPLILNFDSDSVSCNGGSNGTATATVTGGTPNYTYLWNDILAQTTATATNLAAGPYSVTVTDNNNCNETGSITIEEPTLLTASVQEPDNIPDFTFAGEYNNQFIYYHSDPLSWTDARAKAQANNGDLVIIQNANDNAYFTSVTIAICWIGMYQDLNDPNYSEPAGAWKWIDGSPLSYSNWAANEPNNSGIQNYGCFNYGGIGFWDDVGANGLPFIMAIDLGSANSLSVSCNSGNDGQTYVTAAGGTVPYSYAWDNGQTTDTAYNLAAGNYIVTVTDDNGCSAIDTATITEPAEINVVDVQKECDTFTWIDGITYTASNNTATDTLTTINGCDSIVTLDLTINNSASFSLANTSTQDSVCLGQSTSIYPSLGFNSTNPNYSFKWTPNTGLSSDSVHAPIVNVNVNTLFTLTVTDSNECLSSDSIQIYVLPIPALDAGADKNICIGDSITLNISGNDTYSWDQGVTNGVSFFPTTTKDYEATALNQYGCLNKDSVKITVNDLPILNLSPDTIVTCNVDSILVDAGLGYNLYAWSNGQNTQQIYAVNSGTYSVTVTDANGCTASDNVLVDILNLDIVQNDTSICLGESITLEATSNIPAFSVTQSMHLVPSEYATIQSAIDASVNGDTIYVSNGTYVENINYNSKSIYLLGENRETTIIDGNQNGSVVTMNGNSVINGFTIQNGTGTLEGTTLYGGGIYCYGQDEIYILNSIVQNNIIPTNIYSRAAGIKASDNTFITDCVIRNNSAADYVGGIYGGSVSNCKFYNNFPSGYQPTLMSTIGFNNLFVGNHIGIHIDYNDSATISNAVFINNFSSIRLLNSLGNIFINSIFVNNTNVVDFWNSSPSSFNQLTIDYSNIDQNDNLIINNTFGQLNNGNNNISLAPQFVDSANGDYRLVPGSPGVDAGNPDLNGNGILWQNDPEDQDPDGTRMDMGYGYAAQGPVVNFSSPIISNSSNNVTYIWSTGETTATISPTPTVTTTYYVSVNNGINSCQDSVTVTVLSTSALVIDTEVCDSMFFAGNNITNSGIYYDTLSNALGCDSVVTLNLTVHNSIATIDSLVACDSAIWNGNLYTKSTGNYVDSLQTINGCDSIVTMYMTINNSFYIEESITACDSMTWNNGITYTQSGIYYDSFYH